MWIFVRIIPWLSDRYLDFQRKLIKIIRFKSPPFINRVEFNMFTQFCWRESNEWNMHFQDSSFKGWKWYLISVWVRKIKYQKVGLVHMLYLPSLSSAAVNTTSLQLQHSLKLKRVSLRIIYGFRIQPTQNIRRKWNQKLFWNRYMSLLQMLHRKKVVRNNQILILWKCQCNAKTKRYIVI